MQRKRFARSVTALPVLWRVLLYGLLPLLILPLSRHAYGLPLLPTAAELPLVTQQVGTLCENWRSFAGFLVTTVVFIEYGWKFMQWLRRPPSKEA